MAIAESPLEHGLTNEISKCPFSGKLNPNRWNISSLIRRFRTEGVNAVAIPVSDGVVTNPAEFKAHTYAFAAIIIPDALDRVRSQRKGLPPYGLLAAPGGYLPLESFNSPKPFQILDQSVNVTLMKAVKATVDDVKANPSNYDPKLVSIYQTSDRYFKEKRDLYDHDTYHFLGRGINTATETMSQVLEAIPKVWAREYPDTQGSPEIYLDIAQKSYPLLQSLAREHLSFFSKLSNELRGGWSFKKDQRTPFFIDRLTFGADGGLVIKTNVFTRVINAFAEHFEKVILRGLPAIGCPASYSSAIKDLWNWHLELAPDVYRAMERNNALSAFVPRG